MERLIEFLRGWIREIKDENKNKSTNKTESNKKLKKHEKRKK